MEAQFIDRILTCVDCRNEFVFTAGEQLFFFDKQFKNDPKRCKPCKSRRSGLSVAANGTGSAAAGISRTETRTKCSACGVQTTVPFKPTQGRPVLCRQCFQQKGKVEASAPGVPLSPLAAPQTMAETVSALTAASANALGQVLSPEAAQIAVASMAAASASSSVATVADLASILAAPAVKIVAPRTRRAVPAEIVAAQEETSAGAIVALAAIEPGETGD